MVKIVVEMKRINMVVLESEWELTYVHILLYLGHGLASSSCALKYEKHCTCSKWPAEPNNCYSLPQLCFSARVPTFLHPTSPFVCSLFLKPLSQPSSLDPIHSYQSPTFFL